MIVTSYQGGSESALDLGLRRAGDETRTRTISLGMSEAGRPDRSFRRPAPRGSVRYRESSCPTDPSGTQHGDLFLTRSFVLSSGLHVPRSECVQAAREWPLATAVPPVLAQMWHAMALSCDSQPFVCKSPRTLGQHRSPEAELHAHLPGSAVSPPVVVSLGGQLPSLRHLYHLLTGD